MRYLQRGLTYHDPARATPGFTLYTPLRNATAYLVNMAGAIVHQWDLPAGPSNYGYLLPNGNLLIALCSADSPHAMARGGIMRELDWDGNLVAEYIDPYQHHDLWIGKSKALLHRGRGCPSASCEPPRRVGGSGGRRRRVRWARIAHTRRSAPTATARTWRTRPRESSWA